MPIHKQCTIFLDSGVSTLKFSDKTIEDIKARLSIVDVVSSYRQVINRNNNYWIRCPFHGGGNERTPSCKLDVKESRYYCFGCQSHGSMFDFVMNMDHVSFPEAVRILADRAGVQLEEESPATEARKKERVSLLGLNEELCHLFHGLLLTSEEAESARTYLAKRKISQETINKFKLGYAVKDTAWLYNYLKQKGFDDDFLVESGFFSKNHFPYPLFSNRLMFPVRNWRGQCVAFGARDLSFRDNAPKYINTPETTVYSKKHNLYAIYESLEGMKKEKKAIICEGNFDAISLHQAGITSAMAPFGTAFTDEQASLLGRYCEEVDLLFDSDSAGQDACVKAIVMLQAKGLKCHVLSLERHKDASEYLEKEGSEALKAALSVSTEAFTYLVTRGLNLYNTKTPKGKSDFVRFLSPYLGSTQSSVERGDYVRQISQLLGIGEVQIEEDLRRDQNREFPRPAEVTQTGSQIRPFRVSAITPDLYLMLLFANHRELFATYTKAFRFGDLKDREAQTIFLALESVRRDGLGKTDEIFLSLIQDDQTRSDVAMSFELPEFKPARAEEVIDEVLDRLELRKLEDRRRLILRQIEQGESEGLGDDDLRVLLAEKIGVDGQIKDLREKLRNA